MATEIPRVFLLDVPQSSAAAQTVNRKKWKHEQVCHTVYLYVLYTYSLQKLNNMYIEVYVPHIKVLKYIFIAHKVIKVMLHAIASVL